MFETFIDEERFSRKMVLYKLQVCSMKSYHIFAVSFQSLLQFLFKTLLTWISLSEGTEVANRVPAVSDFGFGSVRVFEISVGFSGFRVPDPPLIQSIRCAQFLTRK